MKELKCGGRTYEVNDDAYCKNGKVANASSKKLVIEPANSNKKGSILKTINWSNGTGKNNTQSPGFLDMAVSYVQSKAKQLTK